MSSSRWWIGARGRCQLISVRVFHSLAQLGSFPPFSYLVIGRAVMTPSSTSTSSSRWRRWADEVEDIISSTLSFTCISAGSVPQCFFFNQKMHLMTNLLWNPPEREEEEEEEGVYKWRINTVEAILQPEWLGKKMNGHQMDWLRLGRPSSNATFTTKRRNTKKKKKLKTNLVKGNGGGTSLSNHRSVGPWLPDDTANRNTINARLTFPIHPSIHPSIYPVYPIYPVYLVAWRMDGAESFETLCHSRLEFWLIFIYLFLFF